MIPAFFASGDVSPKQAGTIGPHARWVSIRGERMGSVGQVNAVGGTGGRLRPAVRFFDTLSPEGRLARTSLVVVSAGSRRQPPHAVMVASSHTDALPQRCHPPGWAASRAVAAS
jgi:hypothetical protein